MLWLLNNSRRNKILVNIVSLLNYEFGTVQFFRVVVLLPELIIFVSAILLTLLFKNLHHPIPPAFGANVGPELQTSVLSCKLRTTVILNGEH